MRGLSGAPQICMGSHIFAGSSQKKIISCRFWQKKCGSFVARGPRSNINITDHSLNPHTVQSDTTRCGVSRVGHVAKRPRLYRSDTDFTFTGSNLSRLPLDNNNVAIVKKRKKTKKRKKRKIWGEGCFGERPNPKITTSLFDFLANGSAALFA